MKDTSDVWAGCMDGRMQTEASLVHTQVRRARVDDLTPHVHLDHTGRSHLVIEHAIGHDEEVFQLLADASLQRGNNRWSCLVNRENKSGPCLVNRENKSDHVR